MTETKQDLLILSIDPPLPTTGGTVLNFELIKFLSKHYNLHLFFLDTEDIKYQPKDLEKVSAYTKNIEIIKRIDHKSNNKIKHRISRILSTNPRYYNLIDREETTHRITNYLKENKIEKIFLTSMWPTFFVDEFENLRQKTYALLVNVEHELFEVKNTSLELKIYNSWERFRVKNFERKSLKKIQKLACLTQKDKQKIEEWIDLQKVEVIPPIMEPKVFERKPQINKILLTTNLSYTPNLLSTQWFFEKVYKYLDKDIQIDITGIDSNNFLKAVASQHKNVEYHGFVSVEELNDLYSKTSLVFNPTIIGSGFQIKTLDALARNIPVVSTKFSNHLGDIIPSADNPVEFAKLINEHSKDLSLIESFNYTKFYNSNKEKMLEFLEKVIID